MNIEGYKNKIYPVLTMLSAGLYAIICFNPDWESRIDLIVLSIGVLIYVYGTFREHLFTRFRLFRLLQLQLAVSVLFLLIDRSAGILMLNVTMTMFLGFSDFYGRGRKDTYPELIIYLRILLFITSVVSIVSIVMSSSVMNFNGPFLYSFTGIGTGILLLAGSECFLHRVYSLVGITISAIAFVKETKFVSFRVPERSLPFLFMLILGIVLIWLIHEIIVHFADMKQWLFMIVIICTLFVGVGTGNILQTVLLSSVWLGFVAMPVIYRKKDSDGGWAEDIKLVVSWIFNLLGITRHETKKIYADPDVIRVVNYHRTPASEIHTFESHLKWYAQHYQNINYDQFCAYMNNELHLDQPGLIISFDDGEENNYEYAADLLEKYGFTGWFFVSAGKNDGREYMNPDQWRDLVRRGHVIGCHTYSHHRMDESDTAEILQHEIVASKNVLEKELGQPVPVFCWCGGEERTYTKKASDLIRKNYQWGFMTNTALVNRSSNHFQLERNNVEARWPLSLVKFQLCGIMDHIYENKRNRVESLTK